MRHLLAVGLILVVAVCAAVQADDKPQAEEGFVSLFDGQTHKGWQGNKEGYAITDGSFVCQPKGGGNLYTDKEYGDFHLKFEFKLTPGANNGIGIRDTARRRPGLCRHGDSGARRLV